jgi:hypothetical protein
MVRAVSVDRGVFSLRKKEIRLLSRPSEFFTMESALTTLTTLSPKDLDPDHFLYPPDHPDHKEIKERLCNRREIAVPIAEMPRICWANAGYTLVRGGGWGDETIQPPH